MPNRQTTDGNYRYNFQGQEKDPETGMEAFELRLWDGRLGRWLTVDPMGQYASPYLGMGNNPISRIDPDGGSDKEPPINGLEYFSDATGEYFWNATDGNYEVYIEGIYQEKRYVANAFENPIGNFNIIFDLSNSKPKDVFNPDYTINAIVNPLHFYLLLKGPIEDISDPDKYPGVKIFASPHMTEGALTAGNIIYTSNDQWGKSNNTLNHEYGHYLHYKLHFNFNKNKYIQYVCVPSFLSATFPKSITKGEHGESITERVANYIGGEYFHNTTLKNKFRLFTKF